MPPLSHSAPRASIVALLVLAGCQARPRLQPQAPRAVSEIRWDDYDGDGKEEPRQADGVQYSWHSKKD